MPHVGLGGPARSLYDQNVWADHAALYERFANLMDAGLEERARRLLGLAVEPIQATVISVGPAWPCEHEHLDRGQFVDAEIVA